MGLVTVGADIGQVRDYTAICVAEQQLRRGAGGQEDHWLVRHLERLALGTPYPQVAERVAAVVQAVRAKARRPPQAVYADATGVGAPVVDLLRERGVAVTAVYFTHGDRRVVEDGVIRLGKAYLVSRLQALLQSGRLHVPHTPEAKELAQELLDYEIRVDENANDRYGAFHVGTHDDLVTALGLAVQVRQSDFLTLVPSGQTRPSPWR